MKWEQLQKRIVDSYRQHSPYVYDRAREYALLVRLDKPIGSLLLGWPALWALWFAAEGLPDIKILVVFILGIFVMRSAGCLIPTILVSHLMIMPTVRLILMSNVPETGR